MIIHKQKHQSLGKIMDQGVVKNPETVSLPSWVRHLANILGWNLWPESTMGSWIFPERRFDSLAAGNFPLWNGCSWHSIKIPPSLCTLFFSPPPHSTPYCTHPPTPTSIKPLPNIHSAHTHRPPQLPLQTHPHISQTHTQAAQDFLSHALILSSTQLSHSTLSATLTSSSHYLLYFIFWFSFTSFLPGPLCSLSLRILAL